MSVEVKVNGEWRKVAGGTLYADAPVGTISAYGGSSAPSGWLLCQGQAVSRTTYAELFSAIGTSFGSGDGSATFNLPDLRETVPVGSGTRGSGVTAHDTYSVGTFKDDQLQDHQHYHYSGRRNGWDIYAANSGESTYGMLSTSSTVHDNGSYIGEVYNGRRGTTTHGKQLGVNYIIKAVQSAVPADIASAVEEMMKPQSLKYGTTNRTYIGEQTASNNYVLYQIVGNVCYLKGKVTFTTIPSSGNTTLVTDVPKNTIGFFASVYDGNGNTHGMVFMDNNSDVIKCNSLSGLAETGVTYYFSASYIIAS